MRYLHSSFFLTLFLSLNLALGLFSSEAHARTLSVERNKNYEKRAEDIKEIILDAENTCRRGCRYRVPYVDEIRVVEKLTPQHFFTWTKIVSPIGTNTTYNEVFVRQTNEHVITIENTFPSAVTIRRLEQKYKLYHKSDMDRSSTVWSLKEIWKNGVFQHTQVTYQHKSTSNSLAVRMFGSRIRQGMLQAVDAMMRNFED